MKDRDSPEPSDGIAIIGIACRFPGARDAEAFWRNLRGGVESISFFSARELESRGVDPAVLHQANYVKAAPVLEDVELFDATFFGIAPRQAEVLDPQHRVFLECSWQALESAGYGAGLTSGRVGIWAGSAMNTYLLFNLWTDPTVMQSPASAFQVLLGNDKDHLVQRTAYLLNLRGPSVTVQSACSTSLLAVHVACQSLLNGECDIALAGGVAIKVPHKAGYLHQEGMITSPDGHCRAFDARGQGTIFGSGVGVVVLKRLAEALEDGDCVHAVIKGSATNNDGALRVGYTAPGVDGQAQVITEALAMAGVEAETVGYVEAHGTATPIGDPIEMAALAQAFDAGKRQRGSCAVGSVKTNVGHLETAAGIAGLIKTVLMLEHRMLVPSLHFEKPNPAIDFGSTPFYVNTELREWEGGGTARRAGVNSFGMGGTNVHVVLEEAPQIEPSGPSRSCQLLLLSAKTPSALEAYTDDLVRHLKTSPGCNLADVAQTLRIGRAKFQHRRALVCRDVNDAVLALDTRDPTRVWSSVQAARTRPVIFMFSGLGEQYVNMARDLYREEKTFREHVDQCSEVLKPELGMDLRSVLYADEGSQAPGALSAEAVTDRSKQGIDLRAMVSGRRTGAGNTHGLNETRLAQPAVFTIGYSLAQLWMAWGIEPQALIGHSLGEYVAACLAGVVSLKDALALVARRARLIQDLPLGAMLAVPLSEAEVQPLLGPEVSLAAVNGRSLSVLSGPCRAMEELEARLQDRGTVYRRLQTSHAFHSRMMAPIAEALTALVSGIDLKTPRIPYLSNLTGTWITGTDAVDPTYWARHLCETVRFGEGIDELWKEPARIFLEVGPGQSLCSFVLQHPAAARTGERLAIPSLRASYDRQPDVAFILGSLGKLWLGTARVNWWDFCARERRHRLPLPTYPFERQRYWVEPRRQTESAAPAASQVSLPAEPEIRDAFYVPVWRQSAPAARAQRTDAAARRRPWLVFSDSSWPGPQLLERLEQNGEDVIVVLPGPEFTKLDDLRYTVNPRRRDDYTALMREIETLGETPEAILDLWSITANGSVPTVPDTAEESQCAGPFGLLFLAQALASRELREPIRIVVVSSALQEVFGEEKLQPEKAGILAACRVIAQECSDISCRSVDVVVPDAGTWKEDRLVQCLAAEVTGGQAEPVVAYRGNQRWVQTFEAIGAGGGSSSRLRERGAYVITGGLSALGLAVARHLAEKVRARLTLTVEPGFPDEGEWEAWVSTHEDETARKIRQVGALRALGAEPFLVRADVLDGEQLVEVIDRAAQRFGEIHAVVDTGSVAGANHLAPIEALTQGDCERLLEQRAGTLRGLEDALRSRRVDFCLVLTSLSPLLGEAGSFVQAAADLQADAFVRQHNQVSPVPWIIGSSDLWRVLEEGEREETDLATGPASNGRAREVMEAIEGLFSLAAGSHIIISKEPVQWGGQRRRMPERSQTLESVEISTSRYPRPNLPNPYVAPRNEAERLTAEIWQQLFRIEPVGVHDNFFALGGTSLLAAELIAPLSQVFRMPLTVDILLEAATVAELAEAIEGAKIQQREARMAGILAKLDNLSEDEVRQMLAERVDPADRTNSATS